jgi:thioredoxin reductase
LAADPRDCNLVAIKRTFAAPGTVDVTWTGEGESIIVCAEDLMVTENGERHELDALYPALGCTVRSNLATALGASCTENGNLVVNDHQGTTVEGLYAAGDVVTDLHQLSVAFGHAAIAATDIHNTLPPNPR